jgi:hypothetical protein
MSQSAVPVVVFSELPHPISGTAYAPAQGPDKPRVKLGEYQIVPGKNTLPGEIWEAIKDIPQIVKRLDLGRLRTNIIVRHRDLEILRAPASRSYIAELTVKSGSQQMDNPIFGQPGQPAASGGGGSLDALQAEVARLTQQLEQLTSLQQGKVTK